MILAARHGPFYNRMLRWRRYQILESTCPGHISLQLRQHQRLRALLFSKTAYQDPTLGWAQSNPRLAQECLKPPPMNNFIDRSSENMMESLEAYLKWRGWIYPRELCDQSQNRKYAVALISHILSAPLTLASQFKSIVNYSMNKNTNKSAIKLNWCCVGARAEASIPPVYWKEFLMSSRASLLRGDEYSSGSELLSDSLEISLDFIGPDIPPKLGKQCVTLDVKQDEIDSSVTSLLLQNYHSGYFHHSPAGSSGDTDTKFWDFYIFFNPGFGHPNLKKSWEPTLELLLNRRQKETDKARSALLLTAHSEYDMTRDATILSSEYGLKDMIYHENPFASRVSYEDPFEQNHFVRSNNYVSTVFI